MADLIALLTHAKDVRGIIQANPVAYRAGLCEVLDHTQYPVLAKLMYDWPENTLHSAYPVPCPLEFVEKANSDNVYGKCPRIWAYDNLPKYTGEYGAARMRLLDFIISELEKECG